MNRIPYAKPSITDLECEYVNDAVRNGWGDRCYDYINRFESEFAAFVGTDYAIATSSATGALHLGLAGLNIGPGDEVILADINWVATVAPIVHLGATPVLVDVLEDTWCINPRAVERAITPRTKAIIATHIYGNVCDIDALRLLCCENAIELVEDSAEAVGSSFQDLHVGSLGRFGVFSFHGTKTITTGEGGLLVTSDSALYERVLTLSNHGRSRFETKQFWPETIGYKFKISNIQAALGCAQLQRVDELVAEKRQIFMHYKDLASDYPDIAMNPEPYGVTNGYWMPTVVLSEQSGIRKADLLSAYANEGIDARPFFWPLSSTVPLGPPKLNPIAFSISDRGVNLPSFFGIKDSEIEKVFSILRKVIAR